MSAPSDNARNVAAAELQHTTRLLDATRKQTRKKRNSKERKKEEKKRQQEGRERESFGANLVFYLLLAFQFLLFPGALVWFSGREGRGGKGPLGSGERGVSEAKAFSVYFHTPQRSTSIRRTGPRPVKRLQCLITHLPHLPHTAPPRQSIPMDSSRLLQAGVIHAHTHTHTHAHTRVRATPRREMGSRKGGADNGHENAPARLACWAGLG